VRRLLLVEDEPTLLDVLRQVFVQAGWEVYLARTLAEGKERFGEERFDVVLTDKNLPGGPILTTQAGVELVREIRQRDRAVGIVMMTAYGSMESARDTLNLGVDEYVEKPFTDVLALPARLEALAQRADARRAEKPAPTLLTVVVAVAAARRPRVHRVLELISDRIVYVEQPDEIRPLARSEHADLVILDGGSYSEEITCIVAELKARARFAACIVLSQNLSLSDVKRLIELEVKALVDEPIDAPRFSDELRAAVERLRKGR
jgi:DNA-binding response OmpR family regulator